MSKIIAFSGKMGSGKSTAIDILSKLKSDDSTIVTNVKLAGPLYRIQELIYDIISPVYTRPKDFIKDRYLLQILGTDWGRNKISQSLWLDLWKSEVKQRQEWENVIIVCDDLRFDNEAELIKSMGGIIIRLECNKADQRIDTKSGIVNHATEAGINPKYIDYTVDNNGTIKDFSSKLEMLYNLILDKQE